MTPDTRADVERIAAKLTKAQREAVVEGYAYSGHTRQALIASGLADDVGIFSYRPSFYAAHKYVFTHTSLGLAVRAYIQEQGK